MNTSLEAHKCGIGVLTREALVPIGSGPNRTPPLNGGDGIPGTREENMGEKKYAKVSRDSFQNKIGDLDILCC